ncbi:hypothetical protein KSZ_07640 [Dictyobacter formicarum]|uniref:Pyridoxamine 5'-phosphate oxidase putative domain-containing protein n=1 Tax=Dictyobacter formicarum TaxID=2778368 RepID=A0ABQ3VBH2_9CHLR|nr:hypothetical protein KSZ_07640 [Dictyobacter formicarum]
MKNTRFSQTKGCQKYKNLQKDSRVALSIVDPQNPYRYLEVRGRMIRIEEDEDVRFINPMAKKYMGVWTLILITVLVMSAW